MNPMNSANIPASIIMAAGRGSRMKGYAGNKTLLPLVPAEFPFTGRKQDPYLPEISFLRRG